MNWEEQVNRLVDFARGMSTDELAVVVAVAEGLAKGRKTYGALRVDNGHDWLTEAIEEARDQVVYLTAEVIRLRRRQREMGMNSFPPGHPHHAITHDLQSCEECRGHPMGELPG